MKRPSLTAAGAGAAIFCAVAVFEDVGTAKVVQLSITGGALAAAAVWDLAERRIPNRLTVPAALALLAFFAGTDEQLGGILGGLAVAGLLLGISLFRPEAIGMGDAKLALVVALGLTDKALIGLASGCVLAAMFATSRIARRSSAGVAIPLGPFLALGAFIALLV